jgi:hypothetical protein
MGCPMRGSTPGRSQRFYILQKIKALWDPSNILLKGYLGVLSSGVNRPGCEADCLLHLLPGEEWVELPLHTFVACTGQLYHYLSYDSVFWQYLCVTYPVFAATLCCSITQLLRTRSSSSKTVIWIDCTVEVTRVCNFECFPLFFFRVTALKDGCWTWTTCLQDVRYWILTSESQPCMIATLKSF